MIRRLLDDNVAHYTSETDFFSKDSSEVSIFIEHQETLFREARDFWRANPSPSGSSIIECVDEFNTEWDGYRIRLVAAHNYPVWDNLEPCGLAEKAACRQKHDSKLWKVWCTVNLTSNRLNEFCEHLVHIGHPVDLERVGAFADKQAFGDVVQSKFGWSRTSVNAYVEWFWPFFQRASLSLPATKESFTVGDAEFEMPYNCDLETFIGYWDGLQASVAKDQGKFRFTNPDGFLISEGTAERVPTPEWLLNCCMHYDWQGGVTLPITNQLRDKLPNNPDCYQAHMRNMVWTKLVWDLEAAGKDSSLFKLPIAELLEKWEWCNEAIPAWVKKDVVDWFAEKTPKRLVRFLAIVHYLNMPVNEMFDHRSTLYKHSQTENYWQADQWEQEYEFDYQVTF
jgi:hypothetical protein